MAGRVKFSRADARRALGRGGRGAAVFCTIQVVYHSPMVGLVGDAAAASAAVPTRVVQRRYFHSRVGGEVVEPARVPGRSTLRGDDHVGVAVARIEQCGGAGWRLRRPTVRRSSLGRPPRLVPTRPSLYS
jgi:hypothetical protein